MKPSITLTLPIRVMSELNMYEHWATRLRRKDAQQKEVWAAWPRRTKIAMPCVVKFTRYGQKDMDGDNLQSSFKHVRDAVAKELHIDDGSDLVRFEYAQVATRKREYAVTIEVSGI